MEAPLIGDPDDYVECEELVGPMEIATRLKVKHRTIAVWRQRARETAESGGSNDPFPEPLRRISRTPVWDWVVVKEWADRTGRTPKG